MPDDTKLLTPEDVEREYQIRRGTQAAMRHRRQIPFVKIARACRAIAALIWMRGLRSAQSPRTAAAVAESVMIVSMTTLRARPRKTVTHVGALSTEPDAYPRSAR